MTAPHDLDRQLEAFLVDGPTELPDPSFEAVRHRMDSTRQRVVPGPWRVPDMNRFVPLVAGVAAVALAVTVGSRLLPLSTGPTVGAGSTPSMSAAPPSPTASPTAPASPTASASTLPVGPYLVVNQQTPDAPVDITLQIPAAGWEALPEFGGLWKDFTSDPPQAALLAWSWPEGTGFYVYGDPCKSTTTMPATPVTTVDDFAAALAAQASRDASDPVDVTVDGHAGKLVTLHVPDGPPIGEEAFADCEQLTFNTYGTDPSGSAARGHQGPGQIDELWILDVDGDIVVLDAMYRPDTPAALLDELRSIAESATFE